MNSIARIFFSIGNDNHKKSASGSIIEYNDQMFLATAAHCLYDLKSKEISGSIKVEIFDEKAKKKYSFNVESICVPKKWETTQLLTYDYGFCKLENLPSDLIKEPLVPLFNFHSFKDIKIFVSGYPISLFFTKLRVQTGKLNFALYEKENLIGIHCNLGPGASGGPCFFKSQKIKYQIGVTSAKLKEYKKVIWTPVWDTYAKEVLDYLIESDRYYNIY